MRRGIFADRLADCLAGVGRAKDKAFHSLLAFLGCGEHPKPAIGPDGAMPLCEVAVLDIPGVVIPRRARSASGFYRPVIELYRRPAWTSRHDGFDLLAEDAHLFHRQVFGRPAGLRHACADGFLLAIPSRRRIDVHRLVFSGAGQRRHLHVTRARARLGERLRPII
jgi:hypothetical protein